MAIVLSASVWPQLPRLNLMNLSDGCSSDSRKLCWYSISTRSANEQKTEHGSSRLTSSRGHVIAIMCYEMWLIKERQPLIRSSVPPHLTDFLYICMPLKLIDFWFLVCSYPRGTQVTYFRFNVGSSSRFFPACRHAAVKLIGPQMAGFGIVVGFTHHMPPYIMSFVLLKSPEGDCT